MRVSDEHDDDELLDVADCIEFDASLFRHALLAAAIAAATAKFDEEDDDDDELDDDEP